MIRLLPLALFVFLAACQSEAPAPIDPTEGYDAFGEIIEPSQAVPVNLIATEGASLIGSKVKLEGRISEVCQGNGCWLTLQAVDGPLIRIDVPRDESGNYVYTFPMDATGRRAIVAGVLQGDIPQQQDAEMGEHDADEMAEHLNDGEATAVQGGDARETTVINRSVYTLIATGALLERVRA